MKERNYSYSETVKMADLLASNPKLLSAAEKSGIKLGFGDKTITEVCEITNISPDIFMTICNLYSFKSYKPIIGKIDKQGFQTVINYLKSSHKYYKDIHLKNLHEKVHKMVEHCNTLQKDVLNKFYDEYDNEIRTHFAYEEEFVFPYAEALLDENFNLETYRIIDFKEHHTDIQEKLNDFQNIIMKYLADENADHIRFEVLHDIFEIKQDLKAHGAIEDKLFIPMALKLEKEKELTQNIER